MIDVAFTRAELRAVDVAVVIDVLRATSTATQALAAGYRRVLFAETLERARELRAPGRVLAGERGCLRPAGFDQGNSPLEAMEACGEELVLATTNGAPAIVAATRHAPTVLVASLLNLSAVVRVLRGMACDVQIVCAGAEGAIGLDDVYAAGRLCAALRGERTDAAQIAAGVASAFETPLEALARSAAAARLRAANLCGDIAYCALESALEVVGAVIAVKRGVATVADVSRGGDLDATASIVDARDTVRA